MFFVDTTSTVSLSFTDSTFKRNVAVEGGSLYCDGCSWTMERNTFSYGIALNGGQIYSKDIDSTITLDSHIFEYN